MTHRMKGYDGVESVVYSGVMKVSGQVAFSNNGALEDETDKTVLLDRPCTRADDGTNLFL